MFWRDITLSVWRKKTTGLKTKKRLLPLVLAAALCSSPVWAEEATFTANFKDTDLKSFIETVGANLNKTIIMGPGVQGKVSIRTMTPLNERQYYQLFLNLLEAQGYAVVPMENDVLKVVKSSAAKVEPLPLVGEGSDNYAGDEMVIWPDVADEQLQQWLQTDAIRLYIPGEWISVWQVELPDVARKQIPTILPALPPSSITAPGLAPKAIPRSTTLRRVSATGTGSGCFTCAATG